MFGNKLKELISKGKEGNSKKNVENLVVFVVILVITIIIINNIWNGNKETTKQENENTSSKQLAKISDNVNQNNYNESDLETKLENILTKIQGVGEVQVFINYSASNEVVAMYNENSKISNTEETDDSGGIRKIQETDSQKEIIYQEQNGEKIPITQKIIQPKIEGAIITAKGAENANI